MKLYQRYNIMSICYCFYFELIDFKKQGNFGLRKEFLGLDGAPGGGYLL